jgi:hypothetical protein
MQFDNGAVDARREAKVVGIDDESGHNVECINRNQSVVVCLRAAGERFLCKRRGFRLLRESSSAVQQRKTLIE